jgi:ligand-binding sensor domain-containing protein
MQRQNMKIFPLQFFFLLAGWYLPAQSYYFQQISVGEGLPQSQVYAAMQDSRGYLWLGTQGGGLARFDGRSFRHFSIRDGLAGNYVQAIAEGSDGKIWVGANQGVSCYDGSAFRSFSFGQNTAPIVNGLAFLNDKKLWVATSQGLFSLENNSISPVKKPDGTTFGVVTAVFTDSRGAVWVGEETGIFKFENGAFRHLWSRKSEVLDFTETSRGDVLAAVFNIGIIGFSAAGERLGYLSNDLPSRRVQCLWTAPDGRIWAGTQDQGALQLSLMDTAGLVLAELVHLTENQGLCNKNIRCIAGDVWGNVWLGTSGSGVCKFGGQEFEHFDEGRGLRSNFVYSLCPDRSLPDSGEVRSGGVWLSAGDRGFSHFDGKNFRHFGVDSGFINIKCKALHHDRQGRLWTGTEGAGVAVAEMTGGAPSRFRFLNKKKGLAGNWIRDIEEDAAGNIWVATTDGGISKIEVNDVASGSFNFKNFNRENGLDDLTINALHFDRRGRLWFASQRGGVGFLENETLKMLGPESGLPATGFRCLAEDSLGFLWVGTAGRGIGRAAIYENGAPQFQFFGQNDGLASANVYLLQFDRQGRLWVGSERGVDRLRFDAARNIVEVRHFSRAEGFQGIETCQNAALLDENGSLWFGTVNGLTRYRPGSDSLNAVPPKLHFTGVRLFYEKMENTDFRDFATRDGGLKNGAVFPHNKNHLGFEFFAINLSNPEKVAYSWQLIGSEEDWSPFSPRNEVSYANLPPGDYTFRVRAKNDDGAVSELLETSFTIEPPFWAARWFRISVALAAAAAIWGFFRWRLRQVKRQASQEREQLELQNRLLTLEQKSRQLQMNPHFIFNALNSIQSLVTAGNVDSARQYILKFGRLMRAVLDNSRQPLIPVEKEVETLRQYLEMEQFCREGKFDFEISTAGLESDDLQIPPMVLQPFVENAILHGIGPLSDRKGRIAVGFFEKNGLLEVTIRDNGIGIEQSKAVKAGQESRPAAGIAVTCERLEMLRNDAGFASPAVEMRQMTGADGEVEGTEVRVRMKIHG